MAVQMTKARLDRENISALCKTHWWSALKGNRAHVIARSFAKNLWRRGRWGKKAWERKVGKKMLHSNRVGGGQLKVKELNHPSKWSDKN